MDEAHPQAVRRLTVRTATANDLPHMHAIAARALTELLVGRHYTSAQIRAAAELRIHEVEADLVDAGTYYVAEVDGVVVAGSGWSAGGQLHRAEGPTVKSGTAAMRASYVDPRYARRGITTLLARTTETAAKFSGFRRFETMCTPPSAAMRRALGYRLVRYEQAPLADGLTVRLALMRKQLPDLPYEAA